MIYVLYGTEEYLLQKKAKKVIEEKKIESINISKYDLENSPLEAVIEDATTFPMFGEKKAILCESSFFLTSSSKKTSPQNIEVLESYLKMPNENTLLFFIVCAEKLDERKKIVKAIKKVGKIEVCNKEENLFKEAQNLFTDYQITSADIHFLLERINQNPSFLENEIEKLKIYKWDEKIINREDILEVTTKYMDLNIFSFIDSIISKQKKIALETYEELVKLGEEPLAIVIMLANQFRLMYQVKKLMMQGYTEKAISEEYKMHPYRIKMAAFKAQKYSENILLIYLEKLRNLDYQIKTGQIEKSLALELFIIGV